MFRKLCLSLLFLLALNTGCNGQSSNEYDTYLKILESADKKLFAGDIDGALVLFMKIKKNAAKVDNDSIVGEALNVIGTIYSMYGKEDSVLVYSQQILSLKNPSEPVLIDTYAHMGGILRNAQNYDSSLTYFKMGNELIRKTENFDSLLYTTNLLEICTSFINLYQGDSALTYSLEATKYLNPNNITGGQAYAYSKIAEVFKYTYNFKKAREYGQKSIDIASNLNFNEPKIIAELMMADIEYLDNNLDNSIKHLEKAKFINAGKKNRTFIKINIPYLRSILSKNKKLTNEEMDLLLNLKELTQESYDLARIDLILLRARSTQMPLDAFKKRWNQLWVELDAKHLHHYERELLNLKYDYLKGINKWEEALSIKEELEKANRYHLMEMQNYTVHELETQYQKVKQDNKIRLLDKQNEIQTIKIKGKNQLLIGGAVALGLISFLAIFLLKSRRTITSQKQKISKSLEEKDTLLREIHHRVKNNLQVISSLLRLQSNTTDDASAIEALTEGQNRVQSMSLIHQNLYQKENLTGIKMADYLKRLCENLLATYSISKEQITLETDIEDLNLDVESVVPLGLIINELITNSLKYAFPKNRSGVIKISLHEINNKLKLVVSDNGIGIGSMEEMGTSNSFGHRLITSFARKLEAEVSMSGIQGTTVEILISDYTKTS